MNLTQRRFSMLSLLLLSANSAADARTPVFTSEYTDLAKDCRWAFDQNTLTEGQDNALRCRGASNYRLFIYFSAESAVMSVENAQETLVFESGLTLSDYQRGKVEWRIADGRPFAIIARIKNSDKRVEMLEIRGIDSYRAIRGSVAVAGNKRANAEARTLAEQAYVNAAR